MLRAVVVQYYKVIWHKHYERPLNNRPKIITFLPTIYLITACRCFNGSLLEPLPFKAPLWPHLAKNNTSRYIRKSWQVSLRYLYYPSL